MVNDPPEAIPPLRHGDDRKPAPGDLLLVQGFVNTTALDHTPDDDDLRDPEALGRWLAHYELMAPGDPVTDADHDQALRFREALRAVLMETAGATPVPHAIEALNAAAKTAELLVSFRPGGRATLVPVRGGVDGALARLLAIVKCAQEDGTWERLKGCPADTCGSVFYDWSKNRSATWCSMEVCGNRAKARAYRERRRKPG
jgi:predicted RNA-binding Zn ribbon-like protein